MGTPWEERATHHVNVNANVNGTPEHPVLLSQPLVDMTYFARAALMHLALCVCERVGSRP